MLLVVSDLHLEDSPGHFTVDPDGFYARLESVCLKSRRDGVRKIKLLFLGDVFEMLKSPVWLKTDLRPWQSPTSDHEKVVTEIFDGIEATNKCFFDGLKKLSTEYRVEVDYIPGNHDLVLNTPMGRQCRSKLRSLLAMTSTGESMFEPIYTSDDHGVLAIHGHEWDFMNRYGPRGDAIGDAVVIDLVLGIPALARNKDLDLHFLRDLDNVRPQTPKALQQWIEAGLSHAGKPNRAVQKAMNECMLTAMQRFVGTLEKSTFRSWRGHAARLGTRTLFRTAQLLGPRVVFSRIDRSKDEEGVIRHYALNKLQNRHYKLFLCGHTHVPDIVPLDTGRGPAARVYLNTGTWRRVYRRARERLWVKGAPLFAGWDEECLVAIFSSEEQKQLGMPPFEYFRVNRGIRTYPD